MEDNPNRRQPEWKMTRMEDDPNGRRPKWKTTPMEDDPNGRENIFSSSDICTLHRVVKKHDICFKARFFGAKNSQQNLI